MAGANSNIQMTDLDFNSIKSNLKKYLQSQDVLKDYNYEGSALSTLLDILSYNTQYNAYYLNMVANEMFLDSAIQRSSVVSLAKLLNYTPRSIIAPTATIDLKINQVNDASLTLPKFTTFLSEAIDGVNYNFVVSDEQTVAVSSNTAYFTNVTLKQGISSTTVYTVDSITNPSYTFNIPETNVDTTSLTVVVQQSSSNAALEVYTSASDYLTLDGTSTVYFLQESVDGYYQVYFGDGIIGKKLTDGNIVRLSYITTQGSLAAGANNFTLADTISGFANNVVYPITAASSGTDKESIDSIKFQAPKSYSAQSRAVTKDDYITAIQQNNLGYSFDAVNVWGGEENDPPVYGQVFVCLKPAGSYNLTQTQKTRFLQDVIKPISVLTVTPTIVDPDYTYIKLNVNVVYDTNKTTQSATQIESGVKAAIQTFATNTLNTFNSTFNSYDLLTAIQNYSNSIVTSEFSLTLQKKFFPNLSSPTTYNLYYNTPLEIGKFSSGITSSPTLEYRDPANLSNIIEGVYIEEVPTSTNSVESVSVVNPGFGYTATPTVTILGDGSGANATAVLSGTGTITSITVEDGGNNYTSAIAIITPAEGDTSGQLGAAIVNLTGRYGTLRSYYYNNSQVKTILNSNIGTVDYQQGTVTLEAFNPLNVNNELGQFALQVTPTTSIISSSYNKIITIDPYDNNAITVNVTAK